MHTSPSRCLAYRVRDVTSRAVNTTPSRALLSRLVVLPRSFGMLMTSARHHHDNHPITTSSARACMAFTLVTLQAGTTTEQLGDRDPAHCHRAAVLLVHVHRFIDAHGE